MTYTRRELSQRLLGTLMTYGLVESLWARDLWADSVKPDIAAWFKELATMANDLKDQKLTDLEFQKKMEELYARVDLKELHRLVKLDAIVSGKPLPANGAASLGFDLKQVQGLPEIRFGRQIFGCNKDRSIVPHGHSNMCTGFIILQGQWEGRHYDRLESHADHYVIQPTIDRKFGPGELSTISDHKDNVHWFKALTDKAYIFNVHVVGYDPKISGNSGRLYLDPQGEKLAGGKIRAPKMTSAQCHKKYG